MSKKQPGEQTLIECLALYAAILAVAGLAVGAALAALVRVLWPHS
jgi:hypothetical protein